MTPQIPDTFLYEEQPWVLISSAPSPLFLPPQVGLQPRMLHTGCWRGFVCTYALRERRLLLDSLKGRFSSLGSEEQELPSINGVAVQYPRSKSKRIPGARANEQTSPGQITFPEPYPHVYHDLALSLAFSGQVHIGGWGKRWGSAIFHGPPLESEFWLVRELVFRDGVLEQDRSLHQE